MNEIDLKFQSVFHSAIDGIVLINDRGIIEEINQAALDLFGYSKSEVVGKNIKLLMPNPHQKEHDGYISNYQKTRKAKIIGIGREVEGLKKDGSVFPFRLAVSELPLTNKTWYTGFIHDLTKEKAAQQTLKEYAENLENIVASRTESLNTSNSLLQQKIQEKEATEKELIDSQKLYVTIAKNFPNGTITVLDDQLRFVFIEGQGLRDSGIETNQLLNTNYLDSVPNELKDTINQKLNVVLSGIPSTFETETKHQIFRIRAVPLYNDQNQVNRILLVESNITQQKNAEKEIYNSLQKEKDLNELKSKFVSMASHEFRTPLSTIMSSASLIKKYTAINEGEKTVRHADRIQNNVKNLTMILNDFLSLEKLENDNIRTENSEINIIECISEVKEDMMMLKKSQQSITLKEDLSNPLIFTDRFVIQNIMTNLVSNAIKYSGDDGNITIELKRKNSDFIIQVIDDGIGISEEDQKRLFQRFYRASNSGNVQGTGLGLHIVKRYIELVKGELIFKSELNKGSIFGLILKNA